MTGMTLKTWWDGRFTDTASTAVPEDPPHHVGLWLDRGLQWPRAGAAEKGKAERRRLYDAAVAALRPGAPAREAHLHLLAHHERRTPTAPHRRVFHLIAQSRMLLHTATSASVTEGSILLHHTYGTPYIPGSAIKGVLRASARDADAELLAFWFGRGGATDRADDQAAAFDILDALWSPAPTDDSPLAVDIVNPHHADYYTGKGSPRDSEDPVPVHRLSIRPGARFRVVLEFAPGLDERHVQHLCARLERAVDTPGLGAWSTAGYGRARLVPVP